VDTGRISSEHDARMTKHVAGVQGAHFP